MRNIFRLILFTFLIGSSFADQQPNILFIMSDDHAAHAIGAYGSRLAPLNPTPTLDALAGEGMLFENCYVHNSICTPSRACIMTGQYSNKNGVHTLGGRLTRDEQYLAIEMRKAGYQTAMVGKWHLKEEPNFDYYKVLPGQGKYHNPEFRVQGDQPWPKNMVKHDGMHSSDAITDSTLNWFKTVRDPKKPFFMMHHYKAPHDFFDYAKRYETYLEDVDIPEPESMWRQPEFGSIATRGHNDELLPHIGTSIGRRNPRRNYTKSWAKDPNLTDEQAKRLAYNEYLKRYLRCVKGVDDNLKRLFDYLKAEGLYDNTVIMYTGDQGFMLGEHDYMDKRWMYDESQRMPFLVRYPKSIKAGSSTDAIIENVDFAPLMLDFAGVKTPSYMQGRSFRAICETGTEPAGWKQAAYYRYWMHMAHHDNPSHFGIRTKEFKLIFYYGCGMKGENQTPPAWELYNLKSDPKEVKNVYDNPEYAGVVTKLKAQLLKRRKEVGDTDEDFPGIKKVVDEFWDYDEADRARAIQMSADYLNARTRGRTGKSKKPEVLKGGWVKPADSKAPLRKHKGVSEISRNGVYRIGQVGPSSFNVDNAYLLSGDVPPVKPHSFHTPEVKNPFVVVRLDQPRKVRFIKIGNRLGSHQERAEGLTVWASDDEKQWRRIWKAEKTEQDWLIDTGESLKCRFLKFGLERQGTLHLSKVTVFGE